MTFSMGQKVRTPMGIGTVVYADEAYLEVDIGENVIGFNPDCKNVEPWVDPIAKAMAKKEKDEKVAKEEWENLPPVLQEMAKVNHGIGTALIEAIGGSSGTWDELTYRQRMNFAKVKL